MQDIDQSIYCARHQADSMRHAADLVARGFVRHVSGTVALAKAEAWAAKAVTRYGPQRPKATEQRMRQRGEARVRMLFWPTGEPGRLGWALLVSADGAGPVVEQEKLQDARRRRSRLRIAGYELVRETSKAVEAPGEVADAPGEATGTHRRRRGGLTWTWRVAVVGGGDQARPWGQYVQEACRLARHLDARSAQTLIEHETRRPGFAGTLRQRRKLFVAMVKSRGKLARQHGALEVPKRMPYYGRHRAQCRLRELMARQVMRRVVAQRS